MARARYGGDRRSYALGRQTWPVVLLALTGALVSGARPGPRQHRLPARAAGERDEPVGGRGDRRPGRAELRRVSGARHVVCRQSGSRAVLARGLAARFRPERLGLALPSSARALTARRQPRARHERARGGVVSGRADTPLYGCSTRGACRVRGRGMFSRVCGDAVTGRVSTLKWLKSLAELWLWKPMPAQAIHPRRAALRREPWSARPRAPDHESAERGRARGRLPNPRRPAAR
jgi:hypothetical protein